MCVRVSQPAPSKGIGQEPRGVSALADVYAAETARRFGVIPTWTALDPAQLGGFFRAFERGEFSTCVKYFESALKYDSHLKSVSDKRFGDVSSRAWEVQFIEGTCEDDADAARQYSVVKDFFDFLRFSTAQRRDMHQSVAALVEWLMTAVYFGYSVCAADYKPAFTVDGLPTYHAHFCGADLSFFEARERELRICKDYDYSGEALTRGTGEWVVGVYGKPPLVFASMVLYMFKVAPFEDWARAVERFGMPFVMLKTPAKKGSADWAAAVDAVRKMGSNFSGVFGRDVDTELHSLAQAGVSPHESLIEYVDRRMSILWRGGDLSTESRAGADVGGVALQGEECSILAAADAAFIEELFDSQIVQPLLKRVFGAAVKQKVYFRFSRGRKIDVAAAREKLFAAQECGLAVGKAWAYDALGIEQPKDGEAVIDFSLSVHGQARDSETANAGTVAANAKQESGNAKEVQWEAFLIALSELREKNDEEFTAALKDFAEAFPGLADEVLSKSDVAEILADYAVAEMRKEFESAE